MSPPLTPLLKGRYPFRLGCPSFIYPDDIIPNVEKLGPFVDEIELLILESMPSDRLPSPAQIDILRSLKKTHNLTYNVHLPTDISLSGFSPVPVATAVDIMAQVFERMAPLMPETYTLHLPFSRKIGREEHRQEWQETSIESLMKLTAKGIDPRMISVETLFFPYEWLEPVVTRVDTSICLDLGHLILTHQDLPGMIRMFGDRITMVHLHGVDRTGERPKDHTDIGHLTAEERGIIGEFFKTYSGGVSLEMFSYKKLQVSMAHFLQLWP